MFEVVNYCEVVCLSLCPRNTVKTPNENKISLKFTYDEPSDRQKARNDGLKSEINTPSQGEH